MENPEKYPISYIPSSDSAYGGRNASEKLKDIYVTLLWLSLPIVAFTRHKIGTRYISTFNIIFSFLLLNLIGFQVSLIFANFNIPLISVFLPTELISSLFFLTIILTIFFARNLPVLAIIIFVCAVLSFFIDAGFFGYGPLIFMLLITHGFTYVRSIINKRKKTAVNSYFYGKNFVAKSTNSENHTDNTFIESAIFFIAASFFSIVLLPTREPEDYMNIIMLFLIMALANYFISVMQAYSIRQYTRDLSDTDTPMNGNKEQENNTLKAHRVKSAR